MGKNDPQTYDPEKEGYGNPEQWKNAFRERFTDSEIEKVLNGRSPWHILNIEMNSDQSTIKSAYRKLALQFHPDKNPGCSEQFLAVQAAYQILSK